MKKGVLIGLAILLLIILGAGGYAMTGKSKDQTVPAETYKETATGQTTPTVTNTPQKSFKELFTLGQTQKCTFSSQDPKFSGTVYMDSGRAKGNYVMEVEGQKLNNNMLVTDNKTAYMWADGQTMGVKMNLATYDGPTGTINNTTDKSSLDSKVDYKCENWTTDETLFAVPANVKFSEFGAGATTGETGADKCNACNFLPEESKQDCLKALSCN